MQHKKGKKNHFGPSKKKLTAKTDAEIKIKGRTPLKIKRSKRKKNHKMRKKGGGRNDGDWEKKLKYLRKIRILFQMPRMKVRKLKCKNIKERNAHAPFSIILVFEPPTPPISNPPQNSF